MSTQCLGEVGDSPASSGARRWVLRMFPLQEGIDFTHIQSYIRMCVETVGLGQCRGLGCWPPSNHKFMCNFLLPPNLTTNSLLLTGSFTDYNTNSWLIHILYVTCIVYCIFTIKIEKIHLQFCTVFILIIHVKVGLCSSNLCCLRVNCILIYNIYI